jgi:hypothetical protein
VQKDQKSKEEDAKQLKYPCELLTKNERVLLGFLKECPKPYTEITEHFVKNLGMNKRTVNNLLKKAEKEQKIFRVTRPQDKRVFYRVNDLPYEMKFLFLNMDSLRYEKAEDIVVKLFLEKLKNNYILHYPQLGRQQILAMTKSQTKPAIEEVLQQEFMVRWYDSALKTLQDPSFVKRLQEDIQTSLGVRSIGRQIHKPS